MRNFAIQGITLFEQRFEPRARVFSLQQGAILVMTRTIEEFPDGPSQINHRTAFAKHPAIFGINDSTASAREYDVLEFSEFRQHRMFTGAESGFAFDIENKGNPDAGSPFDFVIGIVKLLAEASGQHSSDRRLARTHHSDEKNAPFDVSR